MLYQKRAGLPALFFILVFFTLSILATACYLSALSGPFVFDDIPNFYNLRFVHNVADALNYALSGKAGTRYLSYLSFTLHANSYMANISLPFKLTNVLLHLFNSILVYWLTYSLLQIQKYSHYKQLSFIISCIWFIHPVHTNTILYSIQRMNLLSASFVLSGCIYHLQFIKRSDNKNTPNTSHWIMYNCSLWLIALMAIISKENGILVLAFINLIANYINDKTFKSWQKSISWQLPFIGLIAFLFISHRLNYSQREFSLYERLLSECVILKEYALKIIIPNDHSFSLFYDDFMIVKNITDSRFILAIFFWSGVIFLSKLVDRSINGFLFGILWFLTGHLLESTIIPLELYFDHRNYLPAYGLIFSTTLIFNNVIINTKNSYVKALLLVTGTALTVNTLLVLKKETYYWHNEENLANSFLYKHPRSLRAHQYLADTQFNSGHYQESLFTLNHIEKNFGRNPGTIIQKIAISCLIAPAQTIDTKKAVLEFKSTQMDNTTTDAMQNLYRLIKNKNCPSLSWKFYQEVSLILLKQKKDPTITYNLAYLLVLSYREDKNDYEALKASMTLTKELRQLPYLFLQLDLAIKNHQQLLAEEIYSDIKEFDDVKKLPYRNELTEIDHFMQDYLK